MSKVDNRDSVVAVAICFNILVVFIINPVSVSASASASARNPSF